MPVRPSQLRIIWLPGMQGEMLGDRMFVKGLVAGGATDSRIFDWVGSWWPLTNLRDRAGHTRAADKLAEKLTTLVDTSPGKVNVLIGHSTGAMVILDLLARLKTPAVDQAWLLNAAVSRTYDLQPALQGVRRLINVHSETDWLVLNLATKVFGSADGAFTDCAGHKPFIGPGADSPKLEQIGYDKSWLKAGHVGLHTTALFAPFARDVVLPMVLERT